jgi:transposase
MKGFQLTSRQVKKLKAVHRSLLNKRNAYRINVIILLGTNWTYREVAEALLLDESSAKNYLKRYLEGGLEALMNDNYQGGFTKLTPEELSELELYLEENLYQRVEDIVEYVKKIYKQEYSVSGMTDLLKRMGFVFKKPKAVPGKADIKKQKKFIRKYNKIKKNKGSNDPIYFMDGSHPQHNTKTAYGWIKKGVTKEIKTNTGRQRININGAIDIESLKPITDISDSVNAQSTIRLFKKAEKKHPLAKKIYMITDNARYYRSVLVKEYVKHSKIEMVYLPPYSPNLNLIERLWLFYQKKILHNKYYETFGELKEATVKFFRYATKYKEELSSLLTENFELIGT